MQKQKSIRIKYEFLNYDTVAVSEKFGSKLSHKTAPQQKKLTGKNGGSFQMFSGLYTSLHVYKIM